MGQEIGLDWITVGLAFAAQQAEELGVTLDEAVHNGSDGGQWAVMARRASPTMTHDVWFTPSSKCEGNVRIWEGDVTYLGEPKPAPHYTVPEDRRFLIRQGDGSEVLAYADELSLRIL